MPGTPATRALAAAGIAVREHVYRHDPRASSFGEEAATLLDVDPDRVFKTLVIAVEGLPSRTAIAVVPVSRRLDLGRAATALGGRRAALAEPALAERRTGYVVGGISPMGHRMPHPTAIDDSASAFSTVFVSGGRRGLELELDPADLVRVTGGVLARLTT